MKKALALVIFSILLAPAPWGIALNFQTKECAGYWGGDEYLAYRLPEGWQAYYPDGDVITTEIGTCTWSGVGFESRAENCCRELGYSFVSTNIGEKHGGYTIFSWLIFGATAATCLFPLLILAVVILVLVRMRAKRKALT